ncbi:MAG: hypothetical protein ACYDDF_06480 [Thermoplasmatota archaeon]
MQTKSREEMHPLPSTEEPLSTAPSSPAAKRHMVRARRHVGAPSLDLTIPSAYCNDYRLLAGDVWVLSFEGDIDNPRLVYTRVAAKEVNHHPHAADIHHVR